MIAKKIHIKGIVQGVFFRASTKEMADSLGLTGWVKNERDGSVSIEVYGEEDHVNELESWCHQGPPKAQVHSVDSRLTSFQDTPIFKIIF